MERPHIYIGHKSKGNWEKGERHRGQKEEFAGSVGRRAGAGW
jgi:hypothetical protein